jgi:photosystem II stability/assembly factor-like uncharacterized protein
MRSFHSLFTDSRGGSAAWQSRTLLLLLVLGLILGGFFTFSIVKAQAAAQTHAIQISNLTMIDQQHGWALDRSAIHVYATHQGPEHWNDITPTLLTSDSNTQITTSFFPNATRGYLGVVQDGINVLLLSTQNNGKSWQTTSLTVPEDFQVNQIIFLDAQHGWLNLGRPGQSPGSADLLLMSTQDGGKTWQTVVDTTTGSSSLPLPFGQSARFSFQDPQNGWATGMIPGSYIYFYATHDGGKSWSPVNILPLKGNNDLELVQGYGPYWQNSHKGTFFVRFAMSNGFNHMTTYWTTDGGKTWILGPASPSTSVNELRSSSILNAQQSWGLGYDSHDQFVIRSTHNGGLSWETIHPAGLLKADAMNQVMDNLTFLNSTTGWVFIKDINNNWNLFQSNNGGHNWHILHPVVG